jgi:DNA-binding protein HU-beta
MSRRQAGGLLGLAHSSSSKQRIGGTMNKKEMAAKLAKQTNLSQVKAMEVINAIFDAHTGRGIIAVELDAGRKVTIPGFGTFYTRRRAERTATKPGNQEKMTVPPKTYAHFRSGKTLRERVSE